MPRPIHAATIGAILVDASARLRALGSRPLGDKPRIGSRIANDATRAWDAAATEIGQSAAAAIWDAARAGDEVCQGYLKSMLDESPLSTQDEDECDPRDITHERVAGWIATLDAIWATTLLAAAAAV